MDEPGTRLYAFVADRLDERMRGQYGSGGTDAVRSYADDLRAAQEAHRRWTDAVSAGDELAAAEHQAHLTRLAEPWAGHHEHPLRPAAK